VLHAGNLIGVTKAEPTRQDAAPDTRPHDPARPDAAQAHSGTAHPGTAHPGKIHHDATQIILALATARGADKSICPSEAARVMAERAAAPSWQGFMTPVRQAAIALAREGRLEILRKGKPVAPDAVRGVIRLRIVPAAGGEAAAINKGG
jgi:hypothetical protein